MVRTDAPQSMTRQRDDHLDALRYGFGFRTADQQRKLEVGGPTIVGFDVGLPGSERTLVWSNQIGPDVRSIEPGSISNATLRRLRESFERIRDAFDAGALMMGSPPSYAAEQCFREERARCSDSVGRERRDLVTHFSRTVSEAIHCTEGRVHDVRLRELRRMGRIRMVSALVHGDCEVRRAPSILVRVPGVVGRMPEIYRCLGCGHYWRDADFVQCGTLRGIGLEAQPISEAAYAWAVAEAGRLGWLRQSEEASEPRRTRRLQGERAAPLARGNPHGLPVYTPR